MSEGKESIEGRYPPKKDQTKAEKEGLEPAVGAGGGEASIARNQTTRSKDKAGNAENEPRGRFERIWVWAKDPKHSGAIQAMFTAVIMLTGILYTIFAGLQWSAMQTSNQISREAIISVQRAFLHFRNIDHVPTAATEGVPKAVEGYRFFASWENSGTTPAEGVVSYFAIDEIEKGFSPQFRVAPGTEFRKMVIGPKATINAGEFYKPQNFWTPITKGIHIYFWGWMAYRDVFPGTKLHVTEFCTELRSVGKVVPPGVKPTDAPFSFSV